ncbi:hypothetical protein [Nodularia sphaerocarpa]|uniref:hypothetical protein n=1 Tax=Nodularia sphaerocarpa TaxID=137816 RepID=UPI001EFA3C37|nr:hypothetical protein [Nodularia sphaerocarpa]MDB9376183.1 hypothetical protein [Nodularia sphaerocarpa CS-585]MDB9377094.1 hypothetical protein [Nodularia sphaerocarpa CS-585A2]ULP74276.1 hypothetical protein BDGGKGIB_03940 [Nodularia sphaerocarpa UHCC 0038]
MANHDYPPASLRYLKARLWNLGKPSFWVTAIFLSVIGLVIREYWSNPNMFTYKENPEVNSSVSREDRAITADVDNLPALFRDFNPANVPIVANISRSKSRSDNKDKLVKDVDKEESVNSAASIPEIGTFNSTSPPPGKNPFVLEAENLLESGAFNLGNQSLGINSLDATFQPRGTAAKSDPPGVGVNQTKNGQNPDSIGVLPTPLNLSSNQTLSTLNGATANQINSLGQTAAGGVMQIPPNNGSLPQSSSPTGLNAATGIQPTVGVPNNFPPNSFNNVDSIQGLPSPIDPITVTSPVTSGVETGLEANTSPYSMQPITPSNVTPMSPVVADQNGNLMWRSPTPQMESNSLDSRQIPGQNTGRVQNNDFDFSNFEF